MWILQEMLKGDKNSNYLRFRKALDDLGIEYLIVYYNSNKELKALKDNFIVSENSEEIIEKALSNPFIIRGSVLLDEQLKTHKNNVLGIKNYNLDFSNILEIIDEKDLVNIPKQIGNIDSIYPIADEFFMRPVKDNKAINGGIYTEGQFYEIKRNAHKYNNEKLLSSELIMSELAEIKEEYRFFILNNKIITYSSYRVGLNLDTFKKVPEKVIRYVNEVLSKYNLGCHFVIDIAVLGSGEIKILEFNGVSASGLYNCDEYILIKELNKLI